VTSGEDLWAPTRYQTRKQASLDAASVSELKKNLQKKSSSEKDAAEAFRTELKKRRQAQLNRGPFRTRREHLTEKKRSPKMCANKAWLVQQDWDASKLKVKPLSFIRTVLPKNQKELEQDRLGCGSSANFAWIWKAKGTKARRGFSKNGSEALGFSIKDAAEYQKRCKSQVRRKSSSEKARSDCDGRQDEPNEVVVDIKAQNVRAIWMMETPWTQKKERDQKQCTMAQRPEKTTRRGKKTASKELAQKKRKSKPQKCVNLYPEKTAAELLADYKGKFGELQKPLLIRIFAQAGAVFQVSENK